MTLIQRICSRTPICMMLFVVNTVVGQETQPNRGPSAPIVIHNLHIGRIENLIINPSAAAETVPPGTIPGLPRPPADLAPRAARAVAPEVGRRIEFAPESLSRRGGRDNPFPAQGLEIHVFALGQADATLVLGPADNMGKRKSLLIDMGESAPSSRNFQVVAEKVKALTDGGTHLDYFIATHFHSDHVGYATNGIAGLLFEEEFTIGTVIDVGDMGSEYFGDASRGTYKTFESTMAGAVGAAVTNRVQPQFGTGQVALGGNVTVQILAFAGKSRADDPGVLAKVHEKFPTRYANSPASENDLSIATKISQDHFEFFSAGDLTGAEDTWGGTRLFTHQAFGDKSQTYTNVESWLVNHWLASGIADHDVEVYRANHHGSKHSTSTEFLAALDPEFVIYSCGGKYDHPSKSVVETVAVTAAQFVTSKLAPQVWSSEAAFAQYKGSVVGSDIQISVDPSGTWYWINGDLHRAFSDPEEQSGNDAGEEDIERVFEED